MIKDPKKFTLRILSGLFLGLVFLFSVFQYKPLFYFIVIIFQILSIFELKKMFKEYVDTLLWIAITAWLDILVITHLKDYPLISNLSYLNLQILFPYVMGIIFIAVIIMIKNILISSSYTNKQILDRIVFEFFLYFYFISSLALSIILFQIKNGLLFLLVVVSNYFHDIFAYFTGKIIGKKEFFTNISPNKTLEGYIGGVLGGIISGILVAQYLHIYELGNYKILLMIACISLLCPFGDLFESLIKRVSNVKESGKIILGHGGVLDRLDSLIFSIFISTFIYFIV
ncbi:MAG: phosphatidate cytidylyltransferase [bacterium]